MEKKYYNLDINDICNDLKSSINGLSNNEAKERLEKIGLNEISNDKKNNVILFANCTNIIYNFFYVFFSMI